MIKKTFEELMELDLMVGAMFKKDANLIQSKFSYGYKKFYKKNIEDIFAEYKNELTDMYIDHALADEKTKAIFLTNEGRGFQFDKNELKQIIKLENKIRDKWDVKEYEIEPYFVAPENLPELTEEQKEIFAGVIISNIEEKK